MRNYRLVIILTVLIVVIGCSGIQVSQDYDLSRDFSGLKTYDWQSGTQQKTGDVRVDNPLLDARIRKAVARSLLEKGYQRIVHGTPDFYVAYQYSIRSKIRSDSVRTGAVFGVGSYGRHGGFDVSTGSDIREYDEGMLVIDIIGAGSGDLMWRGTSTGYVSQHSAPEKTTKNVNETVEKILAQFPPQPKI